MNSIKNKSKWQYTSITIYYRHFESYFIGLVKNMITSDKISKLSIPNINYKVFDISLNVSRLSEI